MLENLKVKTRFVILVGVIAFTLAIIALMQTYMFNSELANLKNMYDGGVEDIELIDAIRDVYVQDILNSVHQVYDEEIASIRPLDKIKDTKTEINEKWMFYLKDAKINTEILTNNPSLINRIETQMKEISPLMEKIKNSFKQDSNAIQKLSAQELQIFTNLLKDLRQLSYLHIEETNKDYHNAISTIYAFRTYSLLTFAIIVIFLILIAVWTALSIINPLKKAVDFINKLTLGDLDFQIENCSKNEIGQLFTAMKTLSVSNRKMSDALVSVSKGDLDIHVEPRSEHDSLGLSLVNMIQNLRHITEEIQTQVTTLTTSSQEIVSSVSQVATTSAETAAAITETTTSVEELKQSAYVTDEKAKEVLGNSEETLQVVGTCEKLLQNTMDDMKHISEKMHAITEGIVKLSEHSQTIGRIIETVNDLAERSNLLAVNAAIEAAKAGEHGKGFVVVAQEIRTLAEQSKSGTIQVRSILNEIQNYTTAAVLATEQGSKAVSKGVEQSAQTNKAMQTLSSSVTNVTQAANQIAISSQQQFIGVDQMTTAMNNIKEATTQLVDNMKQIETAVTSLNSIGENLKDITDQYIMTKEDVPKLLGKHKQTGKNLMHSYK